MNLWNINQGRYDERLLALAAGSSNTADLHAQLGDVPEDGGGSFGEISGYFVHRYGFKPSCTIAPFTGDNPSTILALPLRPLDAIVSLGTSTTFLMSTPYYKPDPAVHFMNHPTTPGLYMFMLCYKNGIAASRAVCNHSTNICPAGGLAREQVRDSLPEENDTTDPWSSFNTNALSHAPLNAPTSDSPLKLALYFPRPEIVPNVRAGTYRYTYNPQTHALSTNNESWTLPEDDCRAILESQLLSLRLRSRNLVAPPSPNPKNLPAQPRRIYLVGGSSHNPAIARLVGEILGGVEGVYKLDVGGNSCALGSAYKAVWASERGQGETFEEFIGLRWREDEFAKKVDEGYKSKVYERYALGVEALDAVEKDVLRNQNVEVQNVSTSGAGQVGDTT